MRAKLMSAVVVWSVLVLGGRSAEGAPDPDYRLVQQAIFQNLYAGRIGPETVLELLDVLAKLRPDLFPKQTRNRLTHDIPTIMRLRSSWLQKYKIAAMEAHDAWYRDRRNVIKQQAAPPFKAPLPDELALKADDKADIYASEIEGELSYLKARLTDQDLRDVLLYDFIYGKLQERIARKILRLPQQSANPDLGFQVLRWAVFQYIGQIGGDRVALTKALDRLSDANEIVAKNKEAVVADISRVIRLRREWLTKIVIPALDASQEARVIVQLPPELGIEAGSRVIDTEVAFEKAQRDELAFEVDILGNPKSKLDDTLPSGAQAAAANRIRAGLIIATLDELVSASRGSRSQAR